MKRDLTKQTTWIATLVLLGASLAFAQSLGDYARQVRKDKPTSDTSRHFDNDNIPTTEQLNVVGPDASASANGAQQAPATDRKAAEAQQQQAAAELQKKIDARKEKIDALKHELDLDQREYRLRAAAFYGDAGNALRNAAQWSKDDAQYKSDMDSKQKAIDAANQELADLQEEARKAGIREKESDSDAGVKEKQSDSDKDTEKDK